MLELSDENGDWNFPGGMKMGDGGGVFCFLYQNPV